MYLTHSVTSQLITTAWVCLHLIFVSAEDCFELGRIAYNNEDHYHSVMWMEEALKHHDAESVKTTDRAVLLDYLSFSIYMVRHPRDDQSRS